MWHTLKERIARYIQRPLGQGRSHVCRKPDFNIDQIGGLNPAFSHNWQIRLMLSSSSGPIVPPGPDRFVWLLLL